MTVLDAIKQALMEGGIPENAVKHVIDSHPEVARVLELTEVPPGEERDLIDRLKQHESPEPVAKFLAAALEQKPHLN